MLLQFCLQQQLNQLEIKEKEIPPICEVIRYILKIIIKALKFFLKRNPLEKLSNKLFNILIQSQHLKSAWILQQDLQVEMSRFLKNVRGGGLHYVADFTSTETKMFRGGIRHYPEYNEKLIYGTRDTPMAFHDKIDYERGLVIHSRSNSNQFINFHYMYGGLKTYFWDRWFMGHWYRRNLRNWWLPVVIIYLFGAYTMRLYDNAAYDYYYFSD